MNGEPPDAKWSRLLSLAAHELRAPITPGSGYLRMLLASSDGTERQRQFAAKSQKQWGRIATLAEEMSELSNLEAGELKLDRRRVDLPLVLSEAIAALPPMDDRTVEVTLTTIAEPGTIQGDPIRLRKAFTSVLFALCRELVTSARLFVREERRGYNGRPASWIAIGDADHIDRFAAATPDMLTTFNEWRGGCGLRPAIARRIIEAHGGAVWSPVDGTNAGAVIVLPR